MERQNHHRGHRHDGAVLSIDYYAYASAICGWNPYYKTAFSAACLILCVACDSLAVSLAVILTMGGISVGLGRLPLRRYLSLLSVPLLFILLSGAAIALGVSLQPAGQYSVHLGFFYLYLTQGGLTQALGLMLKALGAVSAMYMLTLSTPASEVIQVLRSLRVPRTLLELMNLIYRYIFILMDTQCRMKHAASARLGYCDYRTALATFGRTASNLLVVSLKKGSTYYQALASRCYSGELRFPAGEKPVRPVQVLLAVGFLMFLILLWRITG